MSVEERVWAGRLGAWQRPFCLQARVSMRGCSRRLQRLACDFGLEESFETSAKRLHEHHAVELSASTLRRITLQHSENMKREQLAREKVRTLPAQGAATIVTQADGSMLPQVSYAPAEGDRRKHRRIHWQEARLLASQEHGSSTTRYAVSFGDVEECGEQWARSALQAGWASHSRLHVLGDGAEWIEKQHDIHFARHGRYLVDFFHVCEYLAPAAPEGQPDWLAAQKSRLRQNQFDAVIAELADRIEPASQPEENAPVRAAHRYLTNRSHAMDYAGAIASGLPIGSGMIESAHRHIFQRRLKLPGAAWLRESAESTAHARALRANCGWDAYWNAPAHAQN